MEWTTANLGIAAESMLLKETDNLKGVALIVIRVYIHVRMQNLINIIGGSMDVQVSFDFAYAGIYAAQYAITNS